MPNISRERLIAQLDALIDRTEWIEKEILRRHAEKEAADRRSAALSPSDQLEILEEQRQKELRQGVIHYDYYDSGDHLNCVSERRSLRDELRETLLATLPPLEETELVLSRLDQIKTLAGLKNLIINLKDSLDTGTDDQTVPDPSRDELRPGPDSSSAGKESPAERGKERSGAAPKPTPKQRIDDYLNAKVMTNKDLASQANCTVTAIYAIKRGDLKRRVGSDTITRVASIIGCEPKELRA